MAVVKFEKDDLVKVNNWGRSFPTYTQWIIDNITDKELISKFVYNNIPCDKEDTFDYKTREDYNNEFKIIHIARRSEKIHIESRNVNYGEELAFIQNTLNDECYLVALGGLELIQSNNKDKFSVGTVVKCKIGTVNLFDGYVINVDKENNTTSIIFRDLNVKTYPNEQLDDIFYIVKLKSETERICFADFMRSIDKRKNLLSLIDTSLYKEGDTDGREQI